MKAAVLASFCLVLVGTSTVAAAFQKVETGFLNRTLILDGDEYRYQVYVPREFRRVPRLPGEASLPFGLRMRLALQRYWRTLFQ